LLDFWCQSRLRWREDDGDAEMQTLSLLSIFMVVILSVSGGFDCLFLPDPCTIQVFFPLKHAILFPFHEPFSIFFLTRHIFTLPRESNYAPSRYRHAKHTSPLVRTVAARILVKSGGEGCGIGGQQQQRICQILRGATGVFKTRLFVFEKTSRSWTDSLVSESRIKCATRMKTKRYSTGAINFWRRIVVLCKANPHKDHAPKPPLCRRLGFRREGFRVGWFRI